MGVEDEMAQVLFENVTRQHRTLQQSFFRSFSKLIEKYGTQEDCWFDGRNEASGKWCRKVSETDQYFPFV
jgi:hypothetical protein